MIIRILFAIGVTLGFYLDTAFSAEERALDASEFEKSIVHLSATRAIPDSEAPWNIQNIDVSGFMGVYIGANRILAPATLVSRAVFIQAQKMEEVTKVPLKVIFVDYEANLALLSPVEGSISDLKPLTLGNDLPLNSDVWLVGIENERQLMRASVRILEMGMKEVVPGGQQLLSYILTGQNKASCKGEPLIRSGKLVGMCLGASDNQPWAHTASTLRHFLQDKLDESSYRGFPILGIDVGVVKSPFLKKDLKWPPQVRGLRVVTVHETSAFADDVKPNDIMSQVDQQPLDNRGFVRNPVWGPVPMRHYISQKYPGDTITLSLYRDGKPLQVSRPLRRYVGQDNQFPGLTFEGDIAHLIIGGLVFREFGVDYLTSFGRDWFRYGPPELLHLYHFKNKPVLSRVRSIIMSHVMPDIFNQGYDKESILILERVNGKAVANLDELRLSARNRALEQGGHKYMVFEFEQGVKIVLPTEGLKIAQARIAKAYNIGNQKSFLDTD